MQDHVQIAVSTMRRGGNGYAASICRFRCGHAAAKTDFDVRKTRPVVIDVVAVRRKHSTPDQGINPLDLNGILRERNLQFWKAFCR